MARMAALVALPVSLAEVLEVRGPDGLSAPEIRAIASQTALHISALLHANAISAVPLKHVTLESVQLTGSGQVRLGHSEICADVYSVAAQDLSDVLCSLGGVILAAARGTAPQPLTSLLTSLRDGHVTLQQLPQMLAETGQEGRPDHQVVALLHEELLGMDSVSQPKRSPSQLELTLNPSINQTATFVDACRGDGLLPVDSGSVSHAGSFPEVALSHTHRSRRPEDSAGGHGDGAPAGREVSDLSPGADPGDGSKVSASTELRNASCVVAGNLTVSTPNMVPLQPPAASHRHDLALEKDMIRLMARQSSAANLATSTPNHSLLAPPTTVGAEVEPPDGRVPSRRSVRRKPSALYGLRPGPHPPGERAFSGPEFVIRARERPRRIQLPQKSERNVGSVLVILLNGQKLEVACNPASNTVADLTKAVFEEEPYPHASLLGLAVLSDRQFLFPPPATRLNKALVSPVSSQITLYQRFKLYPSLDQLPRAAAGLHLLYLQLRQNLLENQLDVSSNQVAQLSSLALLAEFGDRAEKGENGDAAYFLPEHYLPEPLTSQAELLRQLTEGHVTCAEAAAGPAVAERRFVKVAAGCRGYGRHRCSVDLRVKSYSTSTLSIDPSCFRLTRCDPSGRSTTRTLHWSTVSKIEYKRSRRLVVSSAGAEAITFCGDKAKLRCLEYMMQQHLTSFREGMHLSSSHQVYRAKHDPSSPCLTNYCVRTPLSTLANRNAPRRQAPPASPLSTNRNAGSGKTTDENVGRIAATNQVSPLTAKARRRSAGDSLRSRGQLRSAGGWQSASQLAGVTRRRENSPPPAPGIRMGTRIPVSALQRQKLRSREALPHLTDNAYVIAAEIPPTPESALPPGVRPLEAVVRDSATGGGTAEPWPPGPFNVVLHRCPRTGGLGVRVVRGDATEGGALHVESVTAAGPAQAQGRLLPGDVITHIAGCALSTLSYSEAVDRLRRAVDPVSLSLLRRKRRACDVTDGEDSDVSGSSQEKRRCRNGAGGGVSAADGAAPALGGGASTTGSRVPAATSTFHVSGDVGASGAEPKTVLGSGGAGTFVPAAGAVSVAAGIGGMASGAGLRSRGDAPSVNDMVLTRLQRQLSGDNLATPTVAR